MSSTLSELATASNLENLQRRAVERLRREVFEQSAGSASSELLKELEDAEVMLSELEQTRAVAQRNTRTGQILDNRTASTLLGPETTGLAVSIQLRMRQLPTSICHLFDPEANPLLSCQVHALTGGFRRVRVTSFIEGYSASAVETVEVKAPSPEPHEFNMLPPLFLDRARKITEVTRASLNIKVEDLDRDNKIEIHRTHPIWLLARTTAPLAVEDPATGEFQDMSRYLGAFVTPNAPEVMAFHRDIAEISTETSLVGYQVDKALVEPQVRAIYTALQLRTNLTYDNSVIAFTPSTGSVAQRVRLPRESLAGSAANCIDGTVLFASLLESFSLSPAIIVIPGHAFVAWETWGGSDEWKYLETTVIGKKSFEEACAAGESYAKSHQKLKERTKREHYFRRWPLRVLRSTEYGIFPME